MRPIRPKLDAPQVSIAEEQEEFLTIVGAVVKHPDFPGIDVRRTQDTEPFARDVNTIVLAFRPTSDERERLIRGEDLYLSLLTTQIPPVIVTVGPEETAAIYGVHVERD